MKMEREEIHGQNIRNTDKKINSCCCRFEIRKDRVKVKK